MSVDDRDFVTIQYLGIVVQIPVGHDVIRVARRVIIDTIEPTMRKKLSAHQMTVVDLLGAKQVVCACTRPGSIHTQIIGRLPGAMILVTAIGGRTGKARCIPIAPRRPRSRKRRAIVGQPRRCAADHQNRRFRSICSASYDKGAIVLHRLTVPIIGKATHVNPTRRNRRDSEAMAFLPSAIHQVVATEAQAVPADSVLRRMIILAIPLYRFSAE